MITKTDQSLSDVFDVTPTMGEVSNVEVIMPSVQVAPLSSQDEDFALVRASMHNLLLRGQDTLENAIIIANGTEDPDSYNAVSSLIGKMTAAGTKLMELHEIKKKLDPANVAAVPIAPVVTGNTTITGTVFVGSTSELAKHITDMRKNEAQNIIINQPTVI